MKPTWRESKRSTKLFSFDAEAVDQVVAAPRRLLLLLSLWLALAITLVVDLTVEPVVLTAWFTIPALAAAMFFPQRYVGPLAAGALACAVLSGFDSHVLATPAYEFRLGAVVIIGALSVVIAGMPVRQLDIARSKLESRDTALAEAANSSHEAETHMEELEILSRQLIQKQEEQQHSISRELHDNIAQVITAVSTRISLARTTPQMPAWLKQELKDLQGHLNDALTDIRTLARELRPALLDHCGFAAALEKHTRELRERANIEMEVQIDAAAADGFNPENLTHLFRLVQEAMQNIEEHSGATRAWLTLAQRDGEMHLEIGDNGRAFTHDRVTEAQRDGHLGLLGMRERAELLGGSFLLEATPGEGTTIRVSAPVAAAQSDRHGRSIT